MQTGEQTGRILLKIGLVEVDLTEYPPLKQGEKKVLKAEPYKLDVKEMDKWTDEQESLFALFLLKRVRRETTLDEVDELPAKLVQDLVNHCLLRSAKVDSPFSRPSTSSQVSTDGARAISSDGPPKS